MTNTQPHNESRELKAVSAVIAFLALPIYATAAAFPAWDGRFVSIYVGSSVLVIAAGIGLYARRPGLFGSSTVGDALRTSYHRPAAEPVEQVTVADRSVDRVWTPEYVRLLLRQSVIVVAVLTLNITLAAAVPLLLAMAGTEMFFIAAALVLAVFFIIGKEFVTAGQESASQPSDPTRGPASVHHLTPATSPGSHAA